MKVHRSVIAHGCVANLGRALAGDGQKRAHTELHMEWQLVVCEERAQAFWL